MVPLPVEGLEPLGAVVAGMTASWEAAALQVRGSFTCATQSDARPRHWEIFSCVRILFSCSRWWECTVGTLDAHFRAQRCFLAQGSVQQCAGGRSERPLPRASDCGRPRNGSGSWLRMPSCLAGELAWQALDDVPSKFQPLERHLGSQSFCNCCGLPFSEGRGLPRRLLCPVIMRLRRLVDPGLRCCAHVVHFARYGFKMKLLSRKPCNRQPLLTNRGRESLSQEWSSRFRRGASVRCLLVKLSGV